MLSFQPLVPNYTATFRLQFLRVYVRDHKMRQLLVADRVLEANYDGFTLSQSCKGADEAQRLTPISYGQDGQDTNIAGRAGRMYDLGPEVLDDDVDGRRPAVVVWHDRDMFFLIASYSMPVAELHSIAESIY